MTYSNSQTSEYNNNSSTAGTASFSLSRILDSLYIRSKLDEIRRDDDAVNETNLRTSDRCRSNILDIAEFLEGHMLNAGQGVLVQEISRIVTRVFEAAGLERHCYLILEVLPDRHKDASKNQYKNLQSRLAANRIRRHISDIRSIDRGMLDADTLRELRGLLAGIPSDYDHELLRRGEPLTVFTSPSPSTTTTGGGDSQSDGGGIGAGAVGGGAANHHSAFDSLREMEKNRFRTAKLGAPLSTAEQLCQDDPEYASEFGELKKTLLQAIRGHEIIYKWFVEEYPPLTVAHVIKLTGAFRVWNELMRPYFDRKYRRDHMQSIKTAYMRVLHTSTKASHESGIPCAHHLDKNGMPVMRCMTKEQIDSMYPWEVNFIQKLLNTFFYFVEDITEVNEAHGQRNLEDRAIDLSSTLSHQA